MQNKNIKEAMKEYYTQKMSLNEPDYKEERDEVLKDKIKKFQQTKQVYKNHFIQIDNLTNELIGYAPLLDIPFESFREVAQAVIELGYVKKERIIDLFVDAVLFEAKAGDDEISIHKLIQIAKNLKNNQEDNNGTTY